MKKEIMFDQDYGYFGKGTEGYIHYTQAVEDSLKGGGGGGKKPNRNAGCGTTIIGTLIVSVIIIILLF